jgi:hypothetical protein
MFLDDNLTGENDYHSAVKRSREVNDQLYNLGFLIVTRSSIFLLSTGTGRKLSIFQVSEFSLL